MSLVRIRAILVRSRVRQAAGNTYPRAFTLHVTPPYKQVAGNLRQVVAVATFKRQQCLFMCLITQRTA